MDSCAETKSASAFSGVTKSDRVWRKVPESDARSVISTQTFRRALTASVDSCAEVKSACPFSGVSNAGKVWSKVRESEGWSESNTELWDVSITYTSLCFPEE